MIRVKFEGSRKIIGAHTIEFSVEVIWRIGLDNVTGRIKWTPSISPLLGPGLEGEPEQGVIDDIAQIFREVSSALRMGPEHFRILYEGEQYKKPKIKAKE